MLSYRHAFHAGNHADVLKHLVLVHLMEYMTQKPTPLLVIDTHAGAGRYRLDAEPAQKLAEYREGIARLWNLPASEDMPPLVARYLVAVRALNGEGALLHYPGSPWLIQHSLRPEDRLRLFELHGNEARLLARNFQGAGRQVSIHAGDGLALLKSLLPPPSRRGLALIDPSYETAGDYMAVPHALQEALKRFATGIYVVWLPQLVRRETRQLSKRLQSLAPNWLQVDLQVRAIPSDGLGMYGSSLFLLNPPWTLAESLRQTLPWLTRHLAQDEAAQWMVLTSDDDEAGKKASSVRKK